VAYYYTSQSVLYKKIKIVGKVNEFVLGGAPGDQAPAVPQKGVCGLKTTPHLAS
jgi:hypothetical protein